MHGDTEMTAFLKLYVVSIVPFLALDTVATNGYRAADGLGVA